MSASLSNVAAIIILSVFRNRYRDYNQILGMWKIWLQSLHDRFWAPKWWGHPSAGDFASMGVENFQLSRDSFFDQLNKGLTCDQQWSNRLTSAISPATNDRERDRDKILPTHSTVIAIGSRYNRWHAWRQLLAYYGNRCQLAYSFEIKRFFFQKYMKRANSQLSHLTGKTPIVNILHIFIQLIAILYLNNVESYKITNGKLAVLMRTLW